MKYNLKHKREGKLNRWIMYKSSERMHIQNLLFKAQINFFTYGKYRRNA